MHACQMDPTYTAPLTTGSPHHVYFGTRENTLRQATFLRLFLHCLLVDAVGATTLSHLDPELWCYWLPHDIVDFNVDQPGASSFARLLMVNMKEMSTGYWPPLSLPH